jgi:hypothetical protein
VTVKKLKDKNSPILSGLPFLVKVPEDDHIGPKHFTGRVS